MRAIHGGYTNNRRNGSMSDMYTRLRSPRDLMYTASSAVFLPSPVSTQPR